jgi:pimeloyl-ACP methyl ester carboxylesterase
MSKLLEIFDRPSRFGKGSVLAGLAMGALAATAAVVAKKANRAERDRPPQGSFVEVDGVRLHYIERGTGTPVVLLHGNAVRLQDFEASGLVDRLAERHRVIAFDRPGVGFSERTRDRLWTPDAQAALIQKAFSRLGIEKPVVLGHSWGTLVALALALRQDAGVQRLILVSGYYFPTARLDALLVAPVALPLIGDIMRYTVSAASARMLLGRSVKAMFSPLPVPSDFLPTLSREMLVRPSQIRANAEDGTFMVPAAAGLRKRYAEITMPVAIFAGAADKIVDPEAHSRKLHAALSNSELHVLPGVGHMVHYEATAQIVAAAGATPALAPMAA